MILETLKGMSMIVAYFSLGILALWVVGSIVMDYFN